MKFIDSLERTSTEFKRVCEFKYTTICQRPSPVRNAKFRILLKKVLHFYICLYKDSTQGFLYIKSCLMFVYCEITLFFNLVDQVPIYVMSDISFGALAAITLLSFFNIFS